MKEGWEYKTIKECCTELFAGGDVPKPDVSKNKTQNFTVPIYTNGVENEGLYGYTNNARVYEPAVTISARGTIGATFRRYTPFYPAIRLITAVPNKDLLCIDYLYYALKTLTVGNSGTSIPQLTIPNIKNIVIPVPPLSEQQSIVNYLDSAFAKIDAMKANAEKALNEAKALFQASLKEMLEPKEGWEEDTLSNCCIKAKNIKWGKDTPSHKYIDLSSVDRETSQIYNTIVVTPQDAPSRAKQIVTKGDIIFATTRPTLRRVALICENYDGEICSTGFCVLRPKNHLASKWIFYLLKADRFYNYIEPLQSGANYPAVTDSAVKGYVIPVPPLSEQHSIVATLDSLKSKVDRLQENYDKISQECDALKQAILRQVFE